MDLGFGGRLEGEGKVGRKTLWEMGTRGIGTFVLGGIGVCLASVCFVAVVLGKGSIVVLDLTLREGLDLITFLSGSSGGDETCEFFLRRFDRGVEGVFGMGKSL